MEKQINFLGGGERGKGGNRQKLKVKKGQEKGRRTKILDLFTFFGHELEGG